LDETTGPAFPETGKNRNMKKPARKDIETIKRCHQAYERLVMTGAIALGVLQLISIKFE